MTDLELLKRKYFAKKTASYESSIIEMKEAIFNVGNIFTLAKKDKFIGGILTRGGAKEAMLFVINYCLNNNRKMENAMMRDIENEVVNSVIDICKLDDQWFLERKEIAEEYTKLKIILIELEESIRK